VLATANDPEIDIHEFAARVHREKVDRVLISCCSDAAAFERAFGAHGEPSPRLHLLDLKNSCFVPHTDSEQAHAKASRLLRATTLSADENFQPAYNRLAAGNRIVIAADGHQGAQLAQRLRDAGRPSFIVPPSVGTLDAFPPGAVYTGRVVGVKGRLGDFRITVQDVEAPQTSRRELKADQVVIIARDETPAFKQSTGLHLLKNPSEADLDRVAERIRDLIGEFLKPVHVLYNTDTCAGGGADQEACGRCAAACPYEAIGRDPENHLRMKIDHMACEACGACGSACPTTSMRFADPSPDGLYARLAALLAPLSLGAGGERLVVLFHCGDQGRRVLQEASRRPLPYAASVLPVEVPCLRYLGEATLLAPFRLGAAGLAFLGCESCQHGERELFYQKLDFCRLVLDAFALGSERLRLITADDGSASDAIKTLNDFVETLKTAPIDWDGKPRTHWDNREVIADAVETFIAQTGREPGQKTLDAAHPFAFAEVRASGCTMCRSCVNVCPTHAFRVDDNALSLQFKHISCVACGLCERVCPEKVITLKPEIFFDRDALDYRTVVKDDTVACAQCGRAYINRKALEIVEARLLSLESLLDTFAGSRRNLLRMCPDCRAAVAMLEVEKGWKP
jgi:ferredoxin